jgi:acyl dehydratase
MSRRRNNISSHNILICISARRLPTQRSYGLDKVRFLTPVRSGSRVRLQLSTTSVEPKDDGRLLIKGNAILEIENSQMPARVAETLTLVVP